MDVSKSENLTVLNHNNNVQEMLNNEIQNNEILSLSEDNTTLSASNTDNDGALGVPDSGTFVNLRNKIKNIFQKIFPKHVKNMKIELGLLKRFMLKLNHWNINNENEKKYTIF